MSEQKLMSVEELLAEIPEIEYRVVQIGAGKTMRLGSLTAEEIAEWRDSLNNTEDKYVSGLRLIVQSFVDEQGKRIGTPSHVVALRKKSNAMIERILNEVIKLNGLTERALEQRKNA